MEKNIIESITELKNIAELNLINNQKLIDALEKLLELYEPADPGNK